MCGLAGAARLPTNDASFDLTKMMVEDLLSQIEHRGHHATGIAAVGGVNPFIWKKACRVSMVVKSEEWKKVVNSIAPDCPVLIGHVRHATHSNAHKDEAAHPFQEGKVVGAHNGVIYNWREVEKEVRPKEAWINDSQAAFGVLDKWRDPVKALDRLSGWFALTWTRGKHLWLARTEGVPLAVAYLPHLQAMVWNSERAVLERVLRAWMTKDEYESSLVYDIKPNTLYRFDPSQFTQRGTGVVKIDAPFTAARSSRSSSVTVFDSARPGRVTDSDYWSQRGWDTVRGCEKEPERSKRTQGQITLASVLRLVEAQAAKIETLEAEVAHLYRALNEYLPDVFDNATGSAEEVEYVEVELQPQLPLVQQQVCFDCGFGEERGRLLPMPDGKAIHERCVMTDATGAAV